ncbi:MAG: DoxX family membrane protein [Chitinophagaceae bacterium]|nr:DoxX family membrane protein [Chitinophagaceae bacterium]
MMNLMEQSKIIEKKHFPIWLLALRVFLGLALFLRGIQFIKNDSLLQQVITHSAFLQTYPWLHLTIPWFHLLGGILILLGVFTRFAAALQIPVLIGALFFVQQDSNLFFGAFEIPFALLILVLLIVFAIKGDGFFSWKNLINKEQNNY